MKKMQNEGFELHQVESEEELNQLLKTNGLFFIKDEKGRLHCLNYIEELEVVLDEKKGEWVPVAYDIERKSIEDVPFKETWDKLEKKGLSPLKGLWKAYRESAESEKKYFEDLIAKGKRKVIGWADLGKVHFEEIKEEEIDECTAALIKDIREKGYFFAGDQVYLDPIFDGYKTLSFGERAMGQVIANSRGEYGRMEYVNYAWGSQWDEEIFDSTLTPKEGPYIEEKVEVTVSKEELDAVLELVSEEVEDFPSHFYFLPLSGERFYWSKDGVTLIDEKDKTRKIQCFPYSYFQVEKLEDLIDHIGWLKDRNEDDENKIEICENLKKIGVLLEKGSVTILVFAK